MAQLRTGSLCLTDLNNKAKEGHSAFRKADNGKWYVNITVWHNEETDKFGNDSSVMLNSLKDKREQEGKVYVGNLKLQGTSPTPGDARPSVSTQGMGDDLPF